MLLSAIQQNIFELFNSGDFIFNSHFMLPAAFILEIPSSLNMFKAQLHSSHTLVK